VLERLLAGLGLEWEPEILERYAHGSERWTTPGETWKRGVGADLRPSATSKQALNRKQRDRASESLRIDLYDRLFELRKHRWPRPAP
jgi:hypothetical protein